MVIAMKEIILLLAPDPAVRKVLGDALESKGYCVLPVDNIDGAVRWMKETTPDLLIVRQYTENMSGHDAAIFLRRICPGVPVLIVGGLIEDSDLQSRATLHRFEIFPKPFTAGEQLDKVKQVLIDSSSQRSAHGGSQ